MNGTDAFRMFPEHCGKPILTETEIDTIASEFIPNALIDDEEQTSSSNLKVGFTYFGQFIAHDIVVVTNPNSTMHNRIVTPVLNLDSLYGEQSNYRYLFDEQGKFRSGKQNFDVLRDETGKSLIPEPRNDENVIIVQFHRLWQQIHNALCDLVSRRHPSMKNALYIHHQAKRQTIALFHLLTINEYLNIILDEDVFEAYFRSADEYILKASAPWDSLPVEFSHAAFRFGHSMVRSSYLFNDQQDEHGTPKTKTLRDLLRGDGDGNLTDAEKICWKLFFGEEAKDAKKIDLEFASAMGSIPMERHIVRLNLQAGERSRLPSGYSIRQVLENTYPELCQAIKLNQDYQQLTYIGASQTSILKRLYKSQSVPLWLYVLDEARLASSASSYQRKLGKIGSIIVAEVIRKSIVEFYRSENPGLDFSTLLHHIKNILRPYLPEDLINNSAMKITIDKLVEKAP